MFESDSNDRYLLSILNTVCARLGVGLATFSDGWIVEVTDKAKNRQIIGYRFDLNNAAASVIAQDKVAAHEMMKRSAVNSVPHYLYRRGTMLHKPSKSTVKYVSKPLDGSGGNRVLLHENKRELDAFLKDSIGSTLAISPFIDIINETRLIILDDEVLFAYEKTPVIINGLKMFNLSKGAIAKRVEASESHSVLSKRAIKSIGLRLAAVDVVEDSTGTLYVMEVNDSISFERYCTQHSGELEYIEQVYEKIICSMMR